MKMRLQRNFGRALAVALIGFGLAGSADAQILTNGDFENPLGLNVGWSTTVQGGGEVDITGSIAKKRTPNQFWTPPSNGGTNDYFAYLTGSNTAIADGHVQTIYQDTTLLTESGTLSFKYFFDSSETTPTWNDSFRIQIGVWDDVSGQFVGPMAEDFTVDVEDLGPNFDGDTGWLTRNVELAAGSKYRILGTLTNAISNPPSLLHGGPGDQGFTSIAGLDDFVFTEAPPAVPEPTSMTLLLAGGAFGLVLRARWKAKQVPPSEN